MNAFYKHTGHGLVGILLVTSFFASQLQGQDQGGHAAKAGNEKSQVKDSGPGFGLKVGETAPDFTLQDQNGNDVKLSDLTAKGLVAVVFHRSASW